MSWIKMRTDLGDDPRVLKLMKLLHLKDQDFIVGKLWRFWSYIDQHTTDGCLPHLTAELINHQLRMRGFAEALVAVGWLEIDDSGATIPRFDEHNSETAKKRAQAAKRQERHRGVDADPTNPPRPSRNSNATSVTPALRERQQQRYLEKDSEKDKENERNSRSQNPSSVAQLLQSRTARSNQAQKPDPEALLGTVRVPLNHTQQSSFLLIAEHIENAADSVGQMVTIARSLPFSDVYEAYSAWNESRTSRDPLSNPSGNLIDHLTRKAAERGILLWSERRQQAAAAG